MKRRADSPQLWPDLILEERLVNNSLIERLVSDIPIKEEGKNYAI